MPYKFEYTHKTIPKELKRNYKLSDLQRKEIIEKYKNGVSSRKLGLEYNVNKSAILYIVNPAIKERQRKYLLQNKKKFDCSSKEKANEYATKLRHRKHELELQNKLI